MNITDAVNAFYLKITVRELSMLNQRPGLANITYHSMMYLDLIAYQKNCTVSYLAETLRVSKAAVTIKVNELERLGLVEKTQSRQDKRVYYLTVNEDVRERCQIFDTVLHGLDKWIPAHYTSEEVEAFCRILNEVSERYEQGDTHG